VRLLLVDGDPQTLSLLTRHFEQEGWAVEATNDATNALGVLARGGVDVVMTALEPDGVGLTVLRETQGIDLPPPVILMTAFGTLETAIQAIRAGAYDYLTKPFTPEQGSIAVRRGLADRRLRADNRRLRAEVAQRFVFDTIVGRSGVMQALLEQLKAVACSEASVLVIGESGTGKELIARAIHHASVRRAGPFVPVNCAAIPEPLLESELFGHAKGAFTGADRARPGLVAEAAAGTLFLDEVGDLSPPSQAKLLRVLQHGTVRPVGSNEEARVNVRFISATQRDLLALVAAGRFRQDLYYRLAVLPVRVPILRERGHDILLLAEHFLRRAAETRGKSLRFDHGARAWLLRQRWPGNVRELENTVERAAALADQSCVREEHLHTEPARREGPWPTLAALEADYIQRVLAHTKGDKRAAAKVLGISVRTLQRREG
jgi:DNA-binding NtrC family response regulator